MLRKIPTTAAPISFLEILGGLRSLVSARSLVREFESSFAAYIGTKYAFAVNSGTTAFYIILKAMRQFSDKDEVILPAYTVPTLTLPIHKAGLKTKLCDIGATTFNMKYGSVLKSVTTRTLCIVPVHMFGFPCDVDYLLRFGKENDVFVFEDAAQAPGEMIGDRRVGGIGDVACFSLCKGKNFSTFHGGFITTSSDELAEAIKEELVQLPQVGLSYNLAMPIVMIAYAMAMRPSVYGALYPVIANFKSTTVHESFSSHRYTDFQAGIGLRLLTRLEEFNRIRLDNGMKLYRTLQKDDGIILPEIISEATPVFNHFPVVFKDQSRRERVQKRLWELGIDTGRMYMKPIHDIYDLGYDNAPDPFPHATYVAGRLLTLPTHPYMAPDEIDMIIGAFQEVK